jgi:hypothetical protein
VAGGGIAHLLDRELRVSTLVAVARHGEPDGRTCADAVTGRTAIDGAEG